MSLTVELEVFQGPFDLLLHLIKQTKVDIYDIPMSVITEQYLAYLQNMRELSLDIASEYLVMAATLIEIKSRMLLPIEPSDDLDSEYDEDPRHTLVQQLLLYQQFQDVTEVLQERQLQRAKSFARPTSDLSEYQETVPLAPNEVSLDQLMLAMARALERQAARKPKEKEIHHDSMTVSDQIAKMNYYFQHHGASRNVSFWTFIEYGTRQEIITTFMAMLELVRKQVLTFEQEENSADIHLLYIEGV